MAGIETRPTLAHLKHTLFSGARGEMLRLDTLPALVAKNATTFALWQLDIFCEQRMDAVDFLRHAQRHAADGKVGIGRSPQLAEGKGFP